MEKEGYDGATGIGADFKRGRQQTFGHRDGDE